MLIEFYINLTSFDFGNTGMPTMATGSGTATVYDMDGDELTSSVILPAYADVCAFCNQLQSVAKSTIFNGAKITQNIFGINAENTAEALSSKVMETVLNNNTTKNVFNKIDANDVKAALKLITTESESKINDKIFEMITTQNTTVVNVKCPVDVNVYDADGNLCAVISDNEVDNSYNDIYVNVVGDQKNIYLTGDDYYFELTGTDSGTMDYVVKEIDGDGNTTRQITYEGVALTDGCKYYTYVPEAVNHSSTLFDITDSDGSIISPTTGANTEYDNDSTTADGTCGDNVYWKLYDNGTLYIYGSGDMFGYSYIQYGSANNTVYTIYTTPWWSYRDDIKKVILGDEVTSIGNYAFAYCSNLQTIVIGEKLQTIDLHFGSSFRDPFLGCDSFICFEGDEEFLTTYQGILYTKNLLALVDVPTGIEGDIIIPDSVTTIKEYASYGCDNITSVTIPDSVTSISIYSHFFRLRQPYKDRC